jgi:IS5 family transposase
VDASIISAPSSTKNKSGERDPEMHQTAKGKQWYFGMKGHIGVDSKEKIIHTVKVSAANVSDSLALPHLMHGRETRVYGDQAYRGQSDVIRQRSPKAKDFTNQRYRWNGRIDEAERRKNRPKAKIRSRVEHAQHGQLLRFLRSRLSEKRNGSVGVSHRPRADWYAEPDAIAEEVFHIAHQHHSTWTFDLIVRPYAEKWR